MRRVVQFAGSADRIAASDFKKEFDRSPDVRRVVMYYIEALLIQYQQSVLCGTLHPVEERLARWLLIMHDSAYSNTLLLTQDFLAEILGVARTTVTSAARRLQSANLISYRRGRISIRNRSGLERASCECYRVIRTQFERLLPDCGLVLTPARQDPGYRLSYDVDEWRRQCKRPDLDGALWCLVNRDGTVPSNNDDGQ